MLIPLPATNAPIALAFEKNTLPEVVLPLSITFEAYNPIQFNVKCLPEKAIELRESYACVIPGYHMNKQHWNTIICDGSVGQKIIFSWIDDSYELVANSLTKKLKAELDSL